MNDTAAHYYDIYGFVEDNLESAKSIVEAALGITFEAHESSFLGGDYFLLEDLEDISQEHFLLLRNLDIIDNEPIEAEFPHVPTLLYVSETTRSEEIDELLTNSDARFCLLSRNKI